jgi:nitric oxide reductase subunit C
MLSKSQAKKFFLIGTAGFSLVFVGLTIDTFSKIPKQTRQQNLTAGAIRGKHLFDKKNCMGCHTIMGEGAYYAPELTKVIERRGETFVKQMLRDPESMYPGQRKMTNYKFSEQEISDLTEFLTWVGGMDLNGFPPKPDLLQTTTAVVSQRPVVFNQMCTACHAVAGQGGRVGPALDGVGKKFDKNYLVKWLKDPASIKADSKMPKLPLTDQNIEDVANYLSGLKGE